ncbi:MAG: 16S rRNA (cytosine(1402)-N(4))-methyltransferase RsmH [Actinobacteria bacterium]|nr:16S rRNA (cytosine(1402)-N(4))-methyltransferase RsmH [Actinomycetota bacterium]
MTESDTDFSHRPVMLDEIVKVFASVPPGWVLDATLGGAGHATALLEAHPHLRILGLDRDGDALAVASARLAVHGDRAATAHVRFDHLDHAMEALSVDHLSGALFDLGVSSPQLDRTERGFSYRHEAPLDMRMDQREPWTASDIVNGYDESQLAQALRRHGDERFATRIARAIVAARPVETTTQLAEIVVAAIPAAARRTGGHPAKRTFQAIRIELNRELEVLPAALDLAIERTVEGGRIAVLSYHSGEDRIVKQRMRFAETGGCVCPPELPCVCDAVQTVRVVRGIPKTPSEAERTTNPRARSARLRVVERVAPTRRGAGGRI